MQARHIRSRVDESVLVQRESDKSTALLRDCLAFGKSIRHLAVEVFLGITTL
jgi:hypothetical protein